MPLPLEFARGRRIVWCGGEAVCVAKQTATRLYGWKLSHEGGGGSLGRYVWNYIRKGAVDRRRGSFGCWQTKAIDESDASLVGYIKEPRIAFELSSPEAAVAAYEADQRLSEDRWPRRNAYMEDASKLSGELWQALGQAEEQARRFAEEHVRPYRKAWEAASRLVAERSEEFTAREHAAIRAAAERWAETAPDEPATV